MALDLDTFVQRINITTTDNLESKIESVCDLQASRDQPRRLVAAFESQHQVILIFQRDFTLANESDTPPP